MTRLSRFSMAALLLIAAAGVVVLLPAGVKDAPATVSLVAFSGDLAGWRSGNHVPSEILPSDEGVTEHLLRTYESGPRRIWVSVGYYPNQVEGRRPAARELLFPGRGWSELSERTVRLPLATPADATLHATLPATLPATLVVMRSEARRVGILYWYQLQSRPIASDHWYRLMLLYNRLVHRRADGALVRVAFPIPEDAEPAAVAAGHADFIRAFQAELLRRLAR